MTFSPPIGLAEPCLIIAVVSPPASWRYIQMLLCVTHVAHPDLRHDREAALVHRADTRVDVRIDETRRDVLPGAVDLNGAAGAFGEVLADLDHLTTLLR